MKSAFVIGPRRSERIVCKNCAFEWLDGDDPQMWADGAPDFTEVTLSCEAHCSICDDTIV
jgi:hypothetical protein